MANEQAHSGPRTNQNIHHASEDDDGVDFVFPRPKSVDKSNRSSSASYISRFTSLFGQSRPASPQSDKSNRKSLTSTRKLSKEKTDENDEDKGRDPLPDDQNGLEARLNYHLSELDRLKRIVLIFNDLIEEHEKKLWDVSGRRDAREGMAVSLQKIQALIDETRAARNSHGKFIGYHRIELERVTTKGLRLKESCGEEMKVPEVMKNLANEYAWREMFLV